MENKIPKIIHYCWFGRNPLPPFVKKCIASWKKYCPDYQIIEWNEENFDISCNDYVREAYEAKKWAFVSDVARLHALAVYGGIYMDTDVEVIQSIDCLLRYDTVFGFESQKVISTAFIAAQKGNLIISELLNEYKNQHFIDVNGEYDISPNVQRVTRVLLSRGFNLNNKKQVIQNTILLPIDYLSPKDNSRAVTTLTKNTLVIHHFNGTWLPKKDRFWLKQYQKYNRYFPSAISHLCAAYITNIVFYGWLKGHVVLAEKFMTKLSWVWGRIFKYKGL